jgi:hypothetical protein
MAKLMAPTASTAPCRPSMPPAAACGAPAPARSPSRARSTATRSSRGWAARHRRRPQRLRPPGRLVRGRPRVRGIERPVPRRLHPRAAHPAGRGRVETLSVYDGDPVAVAAGRRRQRLPPRAQRRRPLPRARAGALGRGPPERSRVVTNLFHLHPGKRAPELVITVVEVPADSANKYEYDPTTGIFKLDRVLYSPMHYPGDYGFIPGTYAEDEDPLDILVLMNRPTFPGVVLRARPARVPRDERREGARPEDPRGAGRRPALRRQPPPRQHLAPPPARDRALLPHLQGARGQAHERRRLARHRRDPRAHPRGARGVRAEVPDEAAQAV